MRTFDQPRGYPGPAGLVWLGTAIHSCQLFPSDGDKLFSSFIRIPKQLEPLMLLYNIISALISLTVSTAVSRVLFLQQKTFILHC
jgi:hypothetical protein